MFAEKIHVGFPQRSYRSDVFPVAVKAIGIHFEAVFKHIRDYVFTEVAGRIIVFFIADELLLQYVFFEYVNAHRRERGLGLFRFFFKLENFSVFVRGHYPKAACFFYRYVYNGNRAVGVVFDMLVKHARIIHFVDMVAA